MKTKALEDENLARCLAARRRMERRYKTLDGLCAFLSKLEEGPFPTPAMRRLAAIAKLRPVRASATPFGEARIPRRGKAQAQTPARPPARSGNPVHGKPGARKAVHKV
jgi:hypothetical protein